jgi:hypothetical protein
LIVSHEALISYTVVAIKRLFFATAVEQFASTWLAHSPIDARVKAVDQNWNSSAALWARRGLKVGAALMAAGMVLFLCFGYTHGVYVAEHLEVFQRSPGAAPEYLRVTYGYESDQYFRSSLRLPFIFHKETWWVSPGSPSDLIRFVVLESGTGRPHWLHTKWEYPKIRARISGPTSSDVTRKVLLEAILTLPDGTRHDLSNSRMMYAMVGDEVQSSPVDVRKGQVDSFIRFWLMKDFSLDGLEQCAHQIRVDGDLRTRQHSN